MNRNEYAINVRCPYCGLVQSARVKASRISAKSIVTCDSEEYDGCDRDFVVGVKIQFVATSYRIESESDVIRASLSRSVAS